MITLTKRLRQESEGSKPTKTKKEESRVSIRDKLLVKEVSTCQCDSEKYEIATRALFYLQI